MSRTDEEKEEKRNEGKIYPRGNVGKYTTDHEEMEIAMFGICTFARSPASNRWHPNADDGFSMPRFCPDLTMLAMADDAVIRRAFDTNPTT